MIDLHTHILPALDDGALSPDMSLHMLSMEAEQGVETVVFTPHFYGNQESPQRFLARRAVAWEALSGYLERQGERMAGLPAMQLGAEVAWMPGLSRWDFLEDLRLGESRYILLELPFSPWSGRVLGELYELSSRTGLIPVLAHLERYLFTQRPEYLRELEAMGLPVQISAGSLLRPLRRRRILNVLRNWDCCIASDCHNLTDRRPNLGPAAQAARRLFPEKRARQLLERSGELLGTPGKEVNV